MLDKKTQMQKAQAARSLSQEAKDPELKKRLEARAKKHQFLAKMAAKGKGSSQPQQ